MGSDDGHFHVSLIVRGKVTRQCPQTTTFLKRKESRSGIEPRPFLLPAYHLTVRPNRLTPTLIACTFHNGTRPGVMDRTMTILNQIKHPSTNRHYTTLAVHSISDPPIHPQTLHYICCISPTRPPTACPHPLTPVRSVQAAGSLSDHLIGEEGHRQCPKTVDGDRSRAYRIVHRRCPCHRLRPAVQSRPVKQPFSAHASSDQAIKVGLGRVRSGVLRYRYRSLPPHQPPTPTTSSTPPRYLPNPPSPTLLLRVPTAQIQRHAQVYFCFVLV